MNNQQKPRRRTVRVGPQLIADKGLKRDRHFNMREYTPKWNLPDWRQVMFAPFHDEDRPSILATIVFFALELFGSFLLGLIVNLVRFGAAGPSAIMDGFLIGAAHAAMWLTAWNWTKDYDLRRHLNWGISLSYIFVGNVGILTFILFYGLAQYAGAFAAGGVLMAVGVGVVPDITSAALPTSVATAYGLSFLTSLFIGFSVLYNEKTEDEKEKEIENHKRAGLTIAGFIFAATIALYQFQEYAYSQVIYIAGLTGAGFGAASTTGMGWIFYIFFPLVGYVAAAIVYGIVYALIFNFDEDESAHSSTYNDDVDFGRRGGESNDDMERPIHLPPLKRN